VKELVKGSTPLDFAYSIHTEIGNHCIGAKVNGKIVPLRHSLQSGDTVEVLTSQTQVPSKDWLKFVKTTKAKARIKHWVKMEEHRRSLEIGKRIFERELRRHDLSPSETCKSKKLQEHLGEFGASNLDELLVSIGYGKVSTQQVISRLVPEPALKEGLADKLVKKLRIHDAGVKVRGANDILIRLSKCCNPVPGDQIIGFVTRGRGLSVHTVDCPNIDELDYDRDRIVEVAWDTKDARTHPVGVRVLTLDRPGMLASVSASISAASSNISHAEIITTEEKKAVLNFVVDINDTTHLEKVLKNIRQVDGVLQARRVRKG